MFLVVYSAENVATNVATTGTCPDRSSLYLKVVCAASVSIMFQLGHQTSCMVCSTGMSNQLFNYQHLTYNVSQKNAVLQQLP